MIKKKWHKEIKAWADGEQIQFIGHSEWIDFEEDESPLWDGDSQYRIKPNPEQPLYLYVSQGVDGTPQLSFIEHQDVLFKIKLEVDDD